MNGPDPSTHSTPTIDALLESLGKATPPPGMEQRIVAALEARTQTSSERPRSRLLPAWLHPGYPPRLSPFLLSSLAIACVLLASFTVFVTHPRKQNAVRPPTSPQAVAKALNPAYQPPAMPTLIVEAHSSRKQPLAPTRQRVAVSSEPKSPVQNVSAQGYPAPPMPLTEQEKLLLRIVRQRDPVQLAMLTPEVRQAQDADGKSDFERFFPQPLPPEFEQKLIRDTTHQGERK